jgi:hypothetical protein
MFIIIIFFDLKIILKTIVLISKTEENIIGRNRWGHGREYSSDEYLTAS